MASPPPKPRQPSKRGGSGWWGRMHPEAQRQRLEMLIGILGFFTLAALVSTVIAEVQGRPAVTEAVVLLGFAAALWLAVRAWRAH
jgi:hypothetical protein